MKKFIITAILFLVLPIIIVADRGYLLYEVRDNSVKLYGDKILFPYYYDMKEKDTEFEQYKEIYSFLSMKKDKIYKKTKLVSTPDAQKELSTDKILTFDLDKESIPYIDEIVAETVFTFSENGVKGIKFKNLPKKDNYIFSRKDVKYTSFSLKIEMWRALPPNELFQAYITLPNRDVLYGKTFYEKLKKGDKKLIKYIKDYVQNGSKFEKIAAMRSFPYIKMRKKEIYLEDSLNTKDNDILLADLEGLTGSKKGSILDKVSKIVENLKDPKLKLAASKCLIASGKKKFVILGLNQFLKSDNVDKKIEVIKSISTYKNGEDMLKLMLQDKSDKVVLMTLEYLKSAKKNTTFQEIKKLLDNRSKEIKIAASNILVTNSEFKKFGLFYQLTMDDQKTAIQAAQLLKKYKGDDSSKSLIKCLERKSNEIVVACAKTLIAHKEKKGVIPFFKYVDIANKPIDSLLLKNMIDLWSVKEKKDGLKNSVTSLQKEIILSFRDIFKNKKDNKVVELLAPFLKSKNEILREETIKTLESISGDKALEEVLKIVSDKSEKIRLEIITFLHSFKKDQVKDTLLNYLDDSSDKVRIKAIKGLIKFKVSEAVPKLEQYIMSAIKGVKLISLEAIVTLSDKLPQHLEDKFQELLQEEQPEIKMWAIYGLVKTLKRSVLPFITIYGKDEDYRVRQAVIYAIGELDHASKTKIDMVYSGLEDEKIEVKKEAAKVLGKIGKKVDIKKVKKLISEEKNSDIKQILQSSLSDIERRERED